MKAVVFDMDGVLFDTERLCMDGYAQVAKKCGLPNVEVVARQCIGRNRKDSKQLFLDHYGQGFDYDEFRGAVSAWVKTRIRLHGLPLKPGVEKVLEYLKQNGVPLGLASSTSYRSVLDHLREAGLLEYFRVIVTGDMIENSKPEPDIYLLACRKLDVDPTDTYAIEDSPNGIRAAYRAGMLPIMVPDMIAPDDEMRRLSVRICSDLTEALRFMEEA